MTDLADALRPIVARLVAEELAKRVPANDTTITVAEYARRHSIAISTVRAAIKDGRLDVERIGRAVRIPANGKIEPRVRDAMATARRLLIGR